MALATSSLPVPVSPWIRTAESVRATMCNACQTLRSPCWEPIIALRAADESRGMMLIALATMTLLQMAKYQPSALCRLNNFTSDQIACFNEWQALKSRVECIFKTLFREMPNSRTDRGSQAKQ